MIIDETTIELAAYRLIRIETRRSTDVELGNYARGVVDLQREIHSLLEKEKEYNMTKSI